MASPRFLFDEDVDYRIAEGLWHCQPEVDIICVGKPGGPPKKTPDTELFELGFSENESWLVATRTPIPDNYASISCRGSTPGE